MKVTLTKEKSFGNKVYGKGMQDVPDHLYANAAFKDAVKAGHVVIHPRDQDAQKAQASKDSRNLQKAISAKENAQRAVDERAGLSNPKSASDDFAAQESADMPEPTPAEPAPADPAPKAAQAAPAKSSAAAQATGKSS